MKFTLWIQRREYANEVVGPGIRAVAAATVHVKTNRVIRHPNHMTTSTTTPTTATTFFSTRKKNRGKMKHPLSAFDRNVVHLT